MKTCSKCKTEKPLEEFHFRNKTLNKRRERCKDCWAIYHREHYQKNKSSYVEKAAEQKKVIQHKVLDYLTTHPCIDCGEADPIVLEFDHIEGNKVGSIADLIKHGSWRKVEEEISKCVVRCANCHRRKTAIERGWHRAGLA